MRTQSERTFGSRLRNCFAIATMLQNIPNFYTDQSDLMPSNYFALLQAVVTDNNARTNAEQDYQTATAERQKLFRKDPNSIVKLLRPIKAAVLARYGKDSTELEQITAAIATLRSKAPAPTRQITPLALQATVSQSHLSYGTMTQSFTDLVTKLEGLNNYNSTRTELTIPALKAQAAQAELLSQVIDAAQMNLKILQARRVSNYALITERANKIKALLLSTYGAKSPEYKAIARLSV
jgi:hypothetical protein